MTKKIWNLMFEIAHRKATEAAGIISQDQIAEIGDRLENAIKETLGTHLSNAGISPAELVFQRYEPLIDGSTHVVLCCTYHAYESGQSLRPALLGTLAREAEHFLLCVVDRTTTPTSVNEYIFNPQDFR